VFGANSNHGISLRIQNKTPTTAIAREILFMSSVRSLAQ
jgi:hypothetical protein